MTAYKPGDKIEYRSYVSRKWVPLGTYLTTTSSGAVVCENSEGDVPMVGAGTETRLAPDTVTVTVEIDRAAADEIASFGFTADRPHYTPNGQGAIQAFTDAVTEAVRA